MLLVIFTMRPMVRKTIFWIHLICGVTAGLVILMMSVTGVLLTYERQILDVAGPSVEVPAGGVRRPLAGLIAAVESAEPGFEAGTIAIEADPTEPVVVSAGRGNSRLVDPYTGELLSDGTGGLDAFFSAVTGWHRWFNAPRESRDPWRAITGASNLVFLFLLLSGIYLWLPKVLRWAMFRTRLFFVPLSAPAKARDFNWHHVLGIWTALPLIVIVATASVFYYPWANDLVYRSFGEEPPSRGSRAPQAAAASRGAGQAGALAGRRIDTPTASAPLLTLDALFAAAAREAGDWQTLTLPAVIDASSPVEVSIDRGNGGQPQHRHALLLDPTSGAVAEWRPFQSQSPGRQARSWVRFLHTGEALGIVGQTVAGLVSLTTVLMVWTGLALAWRRLIVPMFARKA